MRQVLGAGALGRPRAMGWGGRWEGGLGWGIHVNPWLIYVIVWQKPLQYCKVISLQLIKINEKNTKKEKREITMVVTWGKNGECGSEEECEGSSDAVPVLFIGPNASYPSVLNW